MINLSVIGHSRSAVSVRYAGKAYKIAVSNGLFGLTSVNDTKLQ